VSSGAIPATRQPRFSSVSPEVYMLRQLTMAALMIAVAANTGAAQTKKPAGTKGVTYDLTITVDGGVYTGKLDLATTAGKVAGAMHITQPTEITGKVVGTSKAGDMVLDFPYRMVQRNCDGQIAMNFKAPSRTAGSKGTVSIAGCGRDASNKLSGTMELKPAK
jgi:hypothetical protein